MLDVRGGIPRSVNRGGGAQAFGTLRNVSFVAGLGTFVTEVRGTGSLIGTVGVPLRPPRTYGLGGQRDLVWEPGVPVDYETSTIELGQPKSALYQV